MQMKERLLPGNGQSLWWQITYTVYVSLTEYKGKLLAAFENYLEGRGHEINHDVMIMYIIIYEKGLS